LFIPKGNVARPASLDSSISTWSLRQEAVATAAEIISLASTEREMEIY
jgi:hypothetical protein